jgi:transketolase
MIDPAAKLANDALSGAPERKAIRDGFGDAIIEAAKLNQSVVAACADVTESVRLAGFREKFPDRFIQLGVHEQLLAALSAGLALAGKKPFAASYAVFSPGRSWEQVRTNICLNGADVVLVGSHAGLSVGPDGATHQALEDIAVTRVLPNMKVVVPCDAVEAAKATLALAAEPGPSYLRLSREKSPVFTTKETPFEIGKAVKLRDGDACAIIACGLVVWEAIVAAEELAKEGIECLVINMHTVKPLDEAAILEAAGRCGAVVTAEEHQAAGGLGSAVAEVLAVKKPVPMEFVAVRDSFGESGSADELMQKYGLTAGDIKEAAKRAIARKTVG